jgi:RHS repeat-associated protein
VVASICNYDPGTQAAPSTAAEATALYDANYPDKNQVTTHEYDALGRRIATTVHAGSAFAQKSLTFYDALDRVWRTIANYAPQGTPATAPGDWEWANGRWEDGSSNAISHGSENNQNIISDTEYNDLGLVRLRRDVLGNVTLYGYDDAGRLVKTIQNASVPTYNNDFSGTTPDPDLSDYTESTSNADQDIITEQEYDAGGNVVKTVGPDGSVTLNGYDVLNRVIKAVQNASAPDYFDTHDDPALSEYDALVNPDEDHITTTEYDAMGRVGQTKRLVETRGGEVWSATYTVYDLLDRPVRTIANYVEQGDPVTAPADWVWANSRWEDGGGNPIDHGTNDQNLITETVYDAAGRVLYTLDMEYNKTWHVYDGLGRQVKTIRNYVVQGSSDPADWVWSEVRERWEYSSSDSTPIDHGDNDLNIITETAYDSDGRVQEIRDVEGKVTRHVYDVLGRRVKTIGNYEAYGETDPADWVWANGLWEDGSSNAIPRGTAFDQNIVAATVYDALERVQSTRDVRGLVPLYGYDSTGRRVKTVQNASNPGYDADSDPDLSGYTASGGPDEDRITTTGYDVAGRVTQVTGPAGIAIRYVYDRLGRRIRVVQNYISNGEDPADWVWDDINDTRWEESDGTPIDHGDNDQNLVSDTAYNKAGQVVATRDTRGTQTTLAYDNAGRRVQVTQAAHTPLETVNYTCFDKAGHVLRTIANANWEPEDNPDEQDTSGDWVWEPYGHGMYEDQNRIVSYEYDAAGRRTKVTDALGNTSETAYGQAGQVLTVTDPEGLVTRHMYDGLKRLKRIIQGYNPPSVLGDKIVFASGSSMVNTRLATVNPDGTNLTYLTGEEGVLGPTWSPNRRKIAFYSYEYPQGLYVIDANGSNRTQLDLDGNNNPVWSPDGNKIAYEVFDSQWDVYMIDADGSNRTRLTNSSGVDWRPSWSPDSGKIVLLANRSANGYDVYVIDADGSNETRLTFSEDVDANWKPRWSPGGGKIAYSKYDEVYVMDADGSNQTRLASGSHPLWSPDGKKIAFIRSAISNYQLFVMDANGENQTYLASNVSSGVSDSRSWSPDGSQICCQKGIAAIYVINADGTGETYLGEGWHPSWAPDYQPTPVDWQWNDSTNRWEESDGTPIVHGTDNDQNVIVDVAYDLAGRKVSQRDPRGNVTEYEYDQLGRRTKLTNPLAKEWTTAYADVTDSGAYTGQTRVALTTPEGYGPTRVYDRLGRMETLEYGSPTNTPDVTFAYDMAGNRSAMTEDDGTNTIRKTDYSYDDVRRLTQVDFDTNGDSTIDETVSYEYGLGGQRTKLTLPGSLDVTYEYDAKGRLVSLTDWDGQQTRLAYDNANRQIALERANGLRTRAVYDVAGRLRKLRHDKSGRTLAHFAYEVDKRGNRTQALECLPHPATTNDTVYAYDDASIVYHGVWSDSSPYKVTSSYASLGVGFFGTQAELIVGKGPDHGIFDVYVDGALWRSFDGYDASTGDLNPIQLNLDGEGPHVLELRNRGEKRPDSTGTALRFKQLTVADLAYDLWTIEYSYDALARLTEARTNPGIRTGAPDADLLRRYQYSFDLTGNRLSMSEALAGGAPTVVNYSYNEANQIMNQNFTYDDNGNLTDDGTNSYVWDRAGRLKEWDNSDPLDKTEYDYDGLGNRISQAIGTSNPTVIQYLLDLQPGLPVMLAQMTGSNTDRFVHLTGHGILAQEDNVGTWTWPVADGLRSVRSVVDDTLNVDSVESYEPFGKPLDGGVFGSPFMFTGEPLDANGLVYLRARYYVPELGAFPSLDPVENLNRYQYVAGNVVNHTDPSGLQGGADTLLGACATLVATPFDFGIVGDIGCVAVIAGLVLAGEIDWQEVAETSEELWERVLDELDIDWDWDLDPGPEPVPLPDLEEVFPPIGIDIDENDRRRRREGPCPTNDPPGSTRPFDIDREIEDIICNIRRYTASSGPQPADWWTGFGGRVSPVFVNALVGQQAMFVGKRSSKAREVLDDGTTRRSIFLSRMMVIPRPGQYGSGEPQTRADIMTFVVHELRHAGQYFSFFSEEIVGGHPLECQNITCRVAEVDAWLKTNHWMVHSVQASRLNTSDFNASINFFNSGNLWTEADLWDHEIMRVYRRILGEGFDLSAYECPGNTAHQSNQNSFCLNALVARHL